MNESKKNYKQTLFSSLAVVLLLVSFIFVVDKTFRKSSRTKEEPQKDLYQIALNELQSSKETEINKQEYSIKAGELFQKNKTHAVIVIKKPDSNKIELFVLKVIDGYWNKIAEDNTNIEWPDIFFQTQDITGDNIPDILVKDWGAANANVGYHLWIFENDTLKQIPGFNELSQSKFDRAKNRIISFRNEGAAGMIYTYREYKLENSQLILTKEISQTDIEGGKYYLLQFYDLKGEKLILTKEQRLNFNQFYDVWEGKIKTTTY